MEKINGVIEITKALLNSDKYMKLYEDDMIECVNLTADAINEITSDAIEIFNSIYNKLYTML